MYPRLALLLTLLCIAGIVSAQDVMTPADGCYQYDKNATPGTAANPSIPISNTVTKWVHDTSQNGANRADKIGSYGFDQTTYKCYRYGNTSYRLRFPNNYSPNNPNKYPLVIFFHGAGEVAYTKFANNNGANRENQDQLYWGAQLFEQRMNQGEWNGFLLFPQIMDNSAQWDANNAAFSDMANVLDTLQKYNGFDPDRLITMGLSAGGLGSVNFGITYPQRTAACVSSNPRFIEGVIYPNQVNAVLQIPIWMAAGGIDNFPGPAQVMQFRDSMYSKGGNIFLAYNPTLGHSSWSSMWNEKDIYNRFVLSTYWNNAHKAQPLLYFQNNQFCNGTPINAKMGITAGFYAYEWQLDEGSGFNSIAGANAETYTATKVGKYRVHFKRTVDANWSDWTPNPIQISTKSCSADTAFVEHFESSPINDYIAFSGGPVFMSSPYQRYNYTCQNGIFVNSTEVFTQDATGRQGGTFMLNNTTASTTSNGCSYFAGDQVWRTYNNASVLPNTDYLLSFYMANNGTTIGGNFTSPATQLVPKINGVALTATPAQTVLTGNISWRKFSYIWNSGNNNSAEIAITNNTTDGTGNNFVLDEISLVKYTPPAMPGGATSNLWVQADTINGYNNSPVKVWVNSNVNGSSILQNNVGREPLFKNNAADNINFNPVVAYNTALNTTNYITGGFSGSGTHTAAHVYMVTRASSTATTQTLISESQTSGLFNVMTAPNGIFSWSAGATLTTPSNINEAGKPILWTLSKDNTNGTGNGNKQDIRKNGILVAQSTNTTTFTGNNANFRVGGTGNTTGTYDGNIAEVIYILDKTINAATENKIESYLALKYGMTLGNPTTPVDYTASDGTTIFWPGVLNASFAKFNNDVFGIGTDSSSGLVQTKSNSVNSGSGDGTGQSGLGNIVVSTNATLLDKKFLMIGNSRAPLTQRSISGGNSLLSGSTRVGRNWKVNNIGVGAVDLSFDTTGLGPQSGGAIVNKYALLISPSGDTTYSGAVTFFTATGASGKKIMFSGVSLPDDAAFTIITNNVSVALPAVWLGFTAEPVSGNGLLKWKTSDEINVATYSVEHSFNGVSFTTVGMVAANNNTGVNNYSFVHPDLAAGIHYYRIRRTDKDGKFEYSDIKSIKITTSGANVQVRPNPVVGPNLVLAVSTQQSSKTTIQVAGVDGKVIITQNANLTSGNNLLNINVGTVPPGIYLVRVQLADEMITRKFIKQR